MHHKSVNPMKVSRQCVSKHSYKGTFFSPCKVINSKHVTINKSIIWQMCVYACSFVPGHLTMFIQMSGAESHYKSDASCRADNTSGTLGGSFVCVDIWITSNRECTPGKLVLLHLCRKILA